MKKLFYLQDKRPIIDFLNSLYGDSIGYDAKITYLNKEAISESLHKKAVFLSYQCDMLIKVEYQDKSYEYLLEFQTKNDSSIGIRMFRYSFELKVQNIRYLNNTPIVIELPNPYVIVLEENKNVPDNYDFILKTPVGESLKYTSRVLKYWQYNLEALYKNNMYLLFPLKVFQVRKKINKLKTIREENPKYPILIKEIKDDILKVSREILEYIEIIFNDKKISEAEYNDFGTVIMNLTSYLCENTYKLTDIHEEVGEMVKTFYDPKVEERGIKIGKLNANRENILELLEDVGNVSEDVKELVEKEENLEILKKWHKMAARVKSIEEFVYKATLN